MASPPSLLLHLFIFSHILLLRSSDAGLTVDYYEKSCPQFQQIMRDTITNKQISSSTTAAATLRLFFHDCMIGGCDASVLVSSTPFNAAERDADINLSLPGDGFDVVVRAKTALELTCPGVVSCADILAVAARDLLTMVGGPFYDVRLGRKDGLASSSATIKGHLPESTMNMSQILSIFRSKGFSIQEMVALSGAHTIGFSHCKEFSAGIYNYSGGSQTDPNYNPAFAEGLKKACSNYHNDPTLSVFNDIMSPNTFDNMYFRNLPRGLGVLSSDHMLHKDQRTRAFVELYAKDQSAFFAAFARAMEKLSRLEVKVGRKGEVRRKCDAFNNLRT